MDTEDEFVVDIVTCLVLSSNDIKGSSSGTVGSLSSECPGFSSSRSRSDEDFFGGRAGGDERGSGSTTVSEIDD